MTDTMIIAGAGFIGTLLVIMAPIVRLNSNITELTVLFRELKSLVQEKTENLDKRVTKHGEEIDELRLMQTKHEERIKQLEK